MEFWKILVYLLNLCELSSTGACVIHESAAREARDSPLLLATCRHAAAGRHAAAACGRDAGHGERSRLQLLFKLGGTKNISILAVNVLAVNSPPRSM